MKFLNNSYLSSYFFATALQILAVIEKCISNAATISLIWQYI